jgi:GT2 family glycosyltransferase
MKKIIGIITYNRSFLLEDCLVSLNKVLGETRSEYTVAVFDDGSTDDTIAFLEGEGRALFDHLNKGARGGVARNSNRAILFAKEQDADILFLLNDDIEFIGNPFPIYEKAIKETPYQHFCYTDSASPNKSFAEFRSGDLTLVQTKLVSDGVCLTITREMIEKLGGFHLAFGFYGVDHTHFSYRASLAGFSRDVLDVKEVKGLIKVTQYYRKIPDSLPNRNDHLEAARQQWVIEYINPQIYQEILI